MGLVHLLCVQGWDVSTTRMSVGEASDVGSKSAVGKAGVTVRGLGGMAKAIAPIAIGTILANRAVEILHTEKVRGDERVPPGV